MTPATPGKPETEAYVFPRWRLLYEVLVFGGLTGFFIWGVLNPSNEGSTFSRVGVLLLAIPVWHYLYQIVRSPQKLVVQGTALEAVYWSGRHVIHDLPELRLAPASFWSRAYWFSQVLNSQGVPQFRIWREANGYREMLELLQTGKPKG